MSNCSDLTNYGASYCVNTKVNGYYCAWADNSGLGGTGICRN